MTHAQAQWVRVTKATPCPVCGHDSWCSIDATDGTVLCMHAKSDRPAPGGGWVHRDVVDQPPPPPPKREKPAHDWAKLAEAYHANLRADELQQFARSLGVDPLALHELGIGRNGVDWTFPMFAADGSVCGIRRRTPSGEKLAMKDASLGLIRRRHRDEGPLLVQEGESDTAAMLTLGFDAVGLPGCGSCHDIVAVYAIGRDVVVMLDGDDAGTKATARLVPKLLHAAKTVRVVRPPEGIKDARAWLQAGATRAAVEAAIAAAPLEQEATAEPTAEAAPEWRPFPLSALPRACRTMVELGADAQQVDPAFWAVPALPILAGCVGNSRVVELKPGWTEPAVLWGATIAPSGSGKSPGLRELLRPVREHDRKLHEKTERRLADYERELAAWQALKPADRADQQKPLVPPMLASVVEDVTTEGLAMRSRDNPRGLLLAVDELGGWLRGFDKYRSGGGDEQRWLSIHAAESIKIDRKGAPGGHPSRIFVPRAAVSIIGTIQPGIARRCLGAQQRESGLAARLLVAAPPTKPAEWTDRTIPERVRDDWRRVVESLLDLRHDDAEARRLYLTPDARRLFVEFHDKNARECFDAGKNGDADLAAALAKLRGMAPRAALVVALAAAADTGTAETVDAIDAPAMAAGIELAEWFAHEARRIYWQWGQEERESIDEAQANRIRDRVRAALEEGEKSLDELRNVFARNVPAAAIKAALRSLNAICKKVQTGGRPREVWRLSWCSDD